LEIVNFALLERHCSLAPEPPRVLPVAADATDRRHDRGDRQESGSSARLIALCSMSDNRPDVGYGGSLITSICSLGLVRPLPPVIAPLVRP